MAIVSTIAQRSQELSNQLATPIAALRSDRALLDEDLRAGKSVSAVLVGVVAMGLLLMIVTVILSMRI